VTDVTEPTDNPAASPADPGGPLAILLAESFELLATRLPQAHARMLALLRGRELELVLDEERMHLRFDHGVELSRLSPPGVTQGGSGCPRIECSVATILAVLDAQITLAEAVESDALRVRADLDRLVHLHDGLLAYVHGAVRCPGFPALLLRLRTLAAPLSPIDP
jgi:hypothetical protein